MIRKLLVANRGEIACRVIATARRMGIATVAVHSDADAGAVHVRLADEAVLIGAAAPAASYLSIGAILGAARSAGADAVHPGYGFLSENSDFAAACIDAGLVFVGPPAEVIRSMGDKSRAKALMREAGIPVVSGYDGTDQEPARLAEEAARIGYPLLIKAAAGGGGRGMRKVMRSDDFPEALASARREADGAFGDDTVLLERLIQPARHIEVQVFGDSSGSVVHLGERDCSAQRRHQKIIEEAPAPSLDGSLRSAILDDAVRAAQAIGYIGAGTVEFVLGPDGAHHFLEMNTRLQVEHPVTEMITGLDLVEWQLRIASGERLPLAQTDIGTDGHAIEARLYAEDPYSGFLPQTGTVEHWRVPAETGPGLRVDGGIAEGDVVTPHYDPMVAKLVAHGASRDEAIARLKGLLLAHPLFGVNTNRSFLLDLLGSDAFETGVMTTDLIDRWVAGRDTILAAGAPSDIDIALAGCALADIDGDWFRSTGEATCPLTLECDGARFEVELHFQRGALSGIAVDGRPVGISGIAISGNAIGFRSDGVARRATVLVRKDSVWLDREGRTFRFEEPDQLAGSREAGDPGRVVSPVAGLVREMRVCVGDVVHAGDTVAVIEAMKMETPLAARADGRVAEVVRAAGSQTRVGDVVVVIDTGDGNGKGNTDVRA